MGSHSGGVDIPVCPAWLRLQEPIVAVPGGIRFVRLHQFSLLWIPLHVFELLHELFFITDNPIPALLLPKGSSSPAVLIDHSRGHALDPSRDAREADTVPRSQQQMNVVRHDHGCCKVIEIRGTFPNMVEDAASFGNRQEAGAAVNPEGHEIGASVQRPMREATFCDFAFGLLAPGTPAGRISCCCLFWQCFSIHEPGQTGMSTLPQRDAYHLRPEVPVG
jgi:hypothetical protein